LPALKQLFVQVLKGLVKLGHVAFDGTKIKANASRGEGDKARKEVA
jgi:hypothetical protein